MLHTRLAIKSSLWFNNKIKFIKWINITNIQCETKEKLKMKENLKFIEIENNVVTICDVMFEPYHVQHLKSFLEHYAIQCAKTQINW